VQHLRCMGLQLGHVVLQAGHIRLQPLRRLRLRELDGRVEGRRAVATLVAGVGSVLE
jgi:hypothetical protein